MRIRLEPFGDVRRELGKRYPNRRVWPASVSQEFQDLDVVFRLKEFAKGAPHRPVEADAVDEGDAVAAHGGWHLLRFGGERCQSLLRPSLGSGGEGDHDL